MLGGEHMTVTVFGFRSKSFRKAKQWLKANDITFKERDIVHEPITMDEILQILRMTEDGTSEIIATRSKAYKELNLNMEEISLRELVTAIQEHPHLLKSPIIVDEKRLLAGFSEEDIRQFLPRRTRLDWRLSHLNGLYAN